MCSVHRRDTMITSGEILRVHRGMFSTSGDIMIHVGEQVDKSLWFILKTLIYSWYPPMCWTSPDVFMISPNVLMVSPNVLNTPLMNCTPPQKFPISLTKMVAHFYFMIARAAADGPAPLLKPSRCTEHPLKHWTHIIQGDFAVLNSGHADWQLVCTCPREEPQLLGFCALREATLIDKIKPQNIWHLFQCRIFFSNIILCSIENRFGPGTFSLASQSHVIDDVINHGHQTFSK